MHIIKADHMDLPNHLDQMDRFDHQGGGSCAKPPRAFAAEKFGLGQKNLSPNTLFCLNIKIFAIHPLFGRLWARQVIFFWGVKTVFLGQEVHYYMVYIAYHNKLNLHLRAKTTNLLRK